MLVRLLGFALLSLFVAPHAHAAQGPGSGNRSKDIPVTDQSPFNGGGPCDDETGISDTGTGCNEQPDQSATSSKGHGTSHRILLHSGQEVYTEEDMYILGQDRVTSLSIKRRYISGHAYSSPFGPGWSLNYHQRIYHEAAGNGHVERFRVFGYGRSDYFEVMPASPKDWEGKEGRLGYLKWDQINSPTVVKLRRRGGSVWTFDYNVTTGIGKLVRVTSVNGNFIEILHSGDNISQIIDSFGRVIDFTYDVYHPDQIASITDFSGRTVNYEYEPLSGRLQRKFSPESPGFTVDGQLVNNW